MYILLLILILFLFLIYNMVVIISFENGKNIISAYIFSIKLFSKRLEIFKYNSKKYSTKKKRKNPIKFNKKLVRFMFPGIKSLKEILISLYNNIDYNLVFSTSDPGYDGMIYGFLAAFSHGKINIAFTDKVYIKLSIIIN